ncbi:hypothetical protein F8M41_006950 [Gigaspora margarita]|uniref:Uncharacterized protein n=1 Tax=Gigaspora margarita TaxID=4874 RepID=A0A8H4ERD9_GIGMA|nr:hypothetical protein F8M41_006950 [Gigaspora margarita]
MAVVVGGCKHQNWVQTTKNGLQTNIEPWMTRSLKKKVRITNITLEKLLNEKYPSETRAEVKEVKIRPRSFDEIIKEKGFLALRV